MPRIRELGVYQGTLEPGPRNAIVDVKGVSVGHCSVKKGHGPWQPGNGPFRTGVTVILPHQGNIYEEKVPAAVHRINGYGKVFGFEQVRELGNIESMIALTGTMNVPRVADALITLAIEENPHIGIGFQETGRSGYPTVNPIVGETSDAFLSDQQARPVGLPEVRKAVNTASVMEVAEGSVGAGMGTSCYGWKGGIGTASRVLPAKYGGYTVGVLVQSNFGRPEELIIGGVPIGRYLTPPDYSTWSPGGSIMIVLATNAPLDSRQLERLCRRVPFGLARTGSTCHGGSGDFVIAFSTAFRILDRNSELLVYSPRVGNEQILIGRLGLAVIEAVEEAVYNSLLTAESVVGRDDHVRHQLPAAEVKDLCKRYSVARKLP